MMFSQKVKGGYGMTEASGLSKWCIVYGALQHDNK